MRIIAKRGGVEHTAPANTLAAVSSALAAGADGVHVDVRLTGDGVPVCCHEPDVRTIAGTYLPIQISPYPTLAAVPRADGQRVPTLADIRASVPDTTPLVVHLHDRRAQAHRPTGLVAAVLPALAPWRSGNVVISSLNPSVLTAVQFAAPGVSTALIGAIDLPATELLTRAVAGRAHHMHPHLRSVLADPDLVTRAHRLGIAVTCWTVDRPVDARLLALIGVDAVITDDPRALRVLVDPVRLLAPSS